MTEEQARIDPGDLLYPLESECFDFALDTLCFVTERTNDGRAYHWIPVESLFGYNKRLAVSAALAHYYRKMRKAGGRANKAYMEALAAFDQWYEYLEQCAADEEAGDD